MGGCTELSRFQMQIFGCARYFLFTKPPMALVFQSCQPKCGGDVKIEPTRWVPDWQVFLRTLQGLQPDEDLNGPYFVMNVPYVRSEVGFSQSTQMYRLL